MGCTQAKEQSKTIPAIEPRTLLTSRRRSVADKKREEKIASAIDNSMSTDERALPEQRSSNDIALQEVTAVSADGVATVASPGDKCSSSGVEGAKLPSYSMLQESLSHEELPRKDAFASGRTTHSSDKIGSRKTSASAISNKSVSTAFTFGRPGTRPLENSLADIGEENQIEDVDAEIKDCELAAESKEVESPLNSERREIAPLQKPDGVSVVAEYIAHALVDGGENLWSQAMHVWTSRYERRGPHDSDEGDTRGDGVAEASEANLNECDRDGGILNTSGHDHGEESSEENGESGGMTGKEFGLAWKQSLERLRAALASVHQYTSADNPNPDDQSRPLLAKVLSERFACL